MVVVAGLHEFVDLTRWKHAINKPSIRQSQFNARIYRLQAQLIRDVHSPKASQKSKKEGMGSYLGVPLGKLS